MSSCPTCGRIISQSESSCSLCSPDNWWDVNSGTQAQPSVSSYFGVTTQNAYSLPKARSHGQASRGLRLGGLAIDVMLFIFLLGLGWFIWFVFLAAKGQTPGKFFLKTRVERADGSSSFATTFWRNCLPNLFSFAILPFTILGMFSLPYGLAFIVSIFQTIGWALPLADALFIFRPDQKRLVDLVFKTRVVRLLG